MKKTQQEPEINKMNRFIIEFPEELNIKSFYIKETNLPVLRLNTDAICEALYYYFWDNITIVFYETISNDLSASQALYNLYNHLNDIKDKNDNDYTKNIKQKDSIFNFKIKLLDSTGNITQEWIIFVEDVIYIDFGYLDYSNDNLITPSIKIKPLKCVLIK